MWPTGRITCEPNGARLWLKQFVNSCAPNLEDLFHSQWLSQFCRESIGDDLGLKRRPIETLVNGDLGSPPKWVEQSRNCDSGRGDGQTALRGDESCDEGRDSEKGDGKRSGNDGVANGPRNQFVDLVEVIARDGDHDRSGQGPESNDHNDIRQLFVR